MESKATFIQQPISGHYPEKYFAPPQSDFRPQAWSWVLFTKPDESQWVACFLGGEGDKNVLASLSETPFVFVVAHGQGYFIHAQTEELIYSTREDTIRDLIANPDGSLLVFADQWNLFTVDRTLAIKPLEVPFAFYFVWFRHLSEGKLEIEYEEERTGSLKTAYLDLKTLQFIWEE